MISSGSSQTGELTRYQRSWLHLALANITVGCTSVSEQPSNYSLIVRGGKHEVLKHCALGWRYKVLWMDFWSDLCWQQPWRGVTETPESCCCKGFQVETNQYLKWFVQTVKDFLPLLNFSQCPLSQVQQNTCHYSFLSIASQSLISLQERSGFCGSL